MNASEMRRRVGAAARFMKSLGNEHRLLILCLLVEGEKSVGELEQFLGVRQPLLSQQLARLRADGLVGTRRASRMIYYRLQSEAAERVVGLLYELFCAEDAAPAAKADGGPPEGGPKAQA